MAKPIADIIPYGDSAFLIRFETDGFSRDICDQIQGLQKTFRKDPIWRECVSAYDSLLLHFDPLKSDPIEVEKDIRKILTSFKPGKLKPGQIIDIPVYYGGEYGPDMPVIAAASGLSEPEIIERHSSIEYLVCMMGFIPGFTFLSETDPALHHPRRTTPRADIPAGSVGIAGWQTGIYGLESPGGWQIIGRTPQAMFDKSRPSPFLLRAGDRVRFVPIRPDA